MDPVGKAKGTYANPPNGKIPRWVCPNCNANLEHFKIGGTAAVPVVINREESGGALHLFAKPKVVTPPTLTAEDLAAAAVGDLYIPMPQTVKEFELVTTGQARPHKRETHTIPGMPKKQAPPRPAPTPVMNHPQADVLNVLDNPLIGGKMTICVLLYGEDHHALHRRCLTSIVTTVPPSRMDLRVACNQVGLETTNYLKTLPITKVYQDYKNRRKYPAMREMFWDPALPITTNFTVWFDDDSYVLNDNWMGILGQTIVAQRPTDKIGMYGAKMFHPMQIGHNSTDCRQWFRNAPWWKGKHFLNKNGREVANGDKLHFVVGGFWAISLEAMKACDIPDTRLNHNGGDVTIGEQVHQGGYQLKQFNEKKQFIKTSGAPRRGFKEKFPFYA